MAIPRHGGSRVVDKRPNLIRDIRRIQARIQEFSNRTRPETLTFGSSDPTRWDPCTSGTMVNVADTLVYRSGDKLLADVACGTGTGSVMEVQLTVPDLSVTGTAVTSASGGTQQTVRVDLAMPASWESGAAHLVYVQARRVSGTDSTTIRVRRAWQR